MDMKRSVSVGLQTLRLHVRNNWKKLFIVFVLSLSACVYLGQSFNPGGHTRVKHRTKITIQRIKNVKTKRSRLLPSSYIDQAPARKKGGGGQRLGLVPVLPGEDAQLSSMPESIEQLGDLGASQFQAPPKICKFSKKPTMKPRDGVMQYFKIRDIYIYSAYLDLRSDARVVRMIGIAPFDPEKFYCQLTYPDGVVISVPGVAVDMQMREREEQQGFRYVAHFFLCREPMDALPVSVSLTGRPCSVTPSNSVIIHMRGVVEENKVPNRFLVCVKLLYNYKFSYRLAEFVEYQRIMRADQVVVYDLEAPSDDVINMVDHYIDQGVMRMQPWKLPIKTSMTPQEGGQIRLYGQHAQVQDCLYRFMDTHKHILIADTDEFIIPHSGDVATYSDLMRRVQPLEPAGQPAASYVFANSHFCLSNKEMVKNIPQLKLLSVVHRNEVESFKHRCKSIINPRRVVEMGVHFVHTPLSGFGRFQHVPPSIAFMHHYRKSKLGNCEVLDKTAQKFNKQLLSRVNKVCDTLGIDRVET